MRKWRPTALQRKEFALRMQNPEEREKYEQEKFAKELAKREKNREQSKYDYATAGGYYAPTFYQRQTAINMLSQEITSEQREAANMVLSAHDAGISTHHDYIHVVNEFERQAYILNQ